ncbi:Orn/DAP/Arg decarboxylase 2 [Alkaliphilus metalliredigens QYMF]|uniref:Orn/DAP/Arg decarboxylase 2 n=1 Tax=Alkaliphilus metalliredigens (strain QYMF) TaxID=293826 RepID=A6TNQ7_ALKMQ|nr:Y4yA family PLP-dependent enzyme [Alkaliphilus metalliredigens]ABR47825.1 Orn/DAP/Arg decarboxylase 2 [Alkaliphilus metalliredigens QYMF]
MIKFTAFLRETIKEFIDEKHSLLNLIDGLGSPLNIIFPEEINQNIEEFKEVFNKHFVSGKVFYAHKTNKSNSIVRQASFEAVNIDVASENELKSALKNGFTGDRIEATGPKNRNFITLGLQHNIIFNIDNLQELDQVMELKKAIDFQNTKKVKILLRFSGFKSESIKVLSKNSKFGIPASGIYQALEKLSQYREDIHFWGFSFHVDTIDLKEKVIAIENCIDFFDIARDHDFEPRVLDIGGGFKVSYIEDAKEWNDSISYLKESILGYQEGVTWNNQTFGIQQEKGVLKGTLNIYNYHDNLTGPKYLDALLSTRLPKFENRTIGTILSENMIDLFIEPGKALVNQLGLSAAKVNFIKQSSDDEILIGLDLKRTDVVMGDQELFIDPIIIHRSKVTDLQEDKGVYFIGNLCLESDLIFKHKIFINQLPANGDIVIFPNTAGYFMDFNATDSIMQPIAKKVAVVKQKSEFKWFIDELYNPVNTH